MHNIEQKIEGSKLILTIDISPKALRSAPPSSRGKTLLIASTHGPVPLPAIDGRQANSR